MEKNYKIGMVKKLLDKEILLMKAGSFLLINKANEAVKIFLQVWEASQENQVFQHGMEVLYKSNQFSRLIKIMERNIGALNKPLLSFYLRSYLSLDKSQKALEILTRYKSLSHTLLWVEVWNANQKHQAIINKLEGLLTSSIDRKTRLAYYLNLANAYFRQKEYSKSKIQFYRALALSKQLDQKSLIYYNLLLTTKLTDNAATFFREANLILKKQLSIESRYRIAQAVSAYYLKYKKYEDADKILTEYIDSYTFDLLKIKTKRLQILVDFKNYQRCFQLSSADISHSSTKDRIDSLIWAGRCGVEVGKLDWIIEEYEGIIESSYRKSERNLILL